MQNTAIIKKLVDEFGEPVVKMFEMPIVGKYNSDDKCREWIKTRPNPSQYYYYYDEDLSAYRIFEMLPVSDSQLTNTILTLQSEKQSHIIGKIHFWVKFWSIVTLIGGFLTLIAVLVN